MADERLWVERDGVRLSVLRFGGPDPGKPPLLLVHGTGFAAPVWQEVAELLADRYSVYALDRRGHGLSDKPAVDVYHFLDFALDLCTVIESLSLREVFGVGHSAGATDLLLAATRLGGRIRRIFAMEPTVMDPWEPLPGGLSAARAEIAERVAGRRAEFASAQAAYDRFRAAPAFAAWSERALWSYVHHGLEPLADSRVRLRCPPAVEAAMLGPIFAAMEQVYRGDARGNPFASLGGLACPVHVATTEGSPPIYKEMAARALRRIPRAQAWSFDGVGHCVAQEAPEQLARAVGAVDRA